MITRLGLLACTLAMCLSANSQQEPCGRRSKVIYVLMDGSKTISASQFAAQQKFTMELGKAAYADPVSTTSVVATQFSTGVGGSFCDFTEVSVGVACVNSTTQLGGRKSIDAALEWMLSQVHPSTRKRDVTHAHSDHVLLITDGASGATERSLAAAEKIRKTMYVTASPTNFQFYIHVLLVPPMPSTDSSGATAAYLGRVASPPRDSHVHVFRSFDDLALAAPRFTSEIWPHAGHVCSVWGDGNVRTFDGLSYAFAGEGDFYMKRVPTSTSRVAIRLARRNMTKTASRVTAVAMELYMSTLYEAYLGKTGGIELYVNNERKMYPRTVGNGVTWQDDNSVTIALSDDNPELRIRRVGGCGGEASLIVTLMHPANYMTSSVVGLCGSYDGCAYNDITQSNSSSTADSFAVQYNETIFRVYPASFLWQPESPVIGVGTATTKLTAACSGLPVGPLRDACIGDVARSGNAACAFASTVLFNKSCAIYCEGSIKNSLLNESDCASFCSRAPIDLHTRACSSKGKVSPLTNIFQPSEFRSQLQTMFGGKYTVGVKGCMGSETVSVTIRCPHTFTVSAAASTLSVNSTPFADEETFAPVTLTGAVRSSNFTNNAAAYRFSWALISNSRDLDLDPEIIQSATSLSATFNPPTWGDYVFEFAAYDGCHVARARTSVRVRCSCSSLDLAISEASSSARRATLSISVTKTLQAEVFPALQRENSRVQWSLALVSGNAFAATIQGPVSSGTATLYYVLASATVIPDAPAVENKTDLVNGTSTSNETTVVTLTGSDNQRRILAARVTSSTSISEQYTYADYVSANSSVSEVLCTVTISPNEMLASVTIHNSNNPSGCSGVFFIRAAYGDDECIDLPSTTAVLNSSSSALPAAIGSDYVYDVFPIEVSCGQPPRAIACCNTIVGWHQSTGAFEPAVLTAYDSYDPDTAYTALTYEWYRYTTGAKELYASTREISFSPTTSGTYTFGLAVSDGCSTDEVNTTVTVLCRQLAVTLSATPTTLTPNDTAYGTTVLIGSTIDSSQAGSGSVSFSYSITSYPSGLESWPSYPQTIASLLTTSGGKTYFTPPVFAGIWVLKVTARDQCNLTSTSSASVTVTPACASIGINITDSSGNVVASGTSTGTVVITQNATTSQIANVILDGSHTTVANPGNVSTLKYLWLVRSQSATVWNTSYSGAKLNAFFEPGNYVVKLQVVGKCGHAESGLISVSVVCDSSINGTLTLSSTSLVFVGHGNVSATFSTALSVASAYCQSTKVAFAQSPGKTPSGGVAAVIIGNKIFFYTSGTYNVSLSSRCNTHCPWRQLDYKIVTVSCGFTDFLPSLVLDTSSISVTYDRGKWSTVPLSITIPLQSSLTNSTEPTIVASDTARFVALKSWTVLTAPSTSMYAPSAAVASVGAWSDTVTSKKTVTSNGWYWVRREHTASRKYTTTSSNVELEHYFSAFATNIHHSDMFFGSCITPDAPGTYVARLSVTDTCGRNAVRDATIVASCNSAPSVLLSQATLDHGRVVVTATAKDSNGDDLTYLWQGPDSLYWTSEDNTLRSFQPVAGSYVYNVTVSDGCSAVQAKHTVVVAPGTEDVTLAVDKSLSYSAELYSQLSEFQIPLRATACSCSVPAQTLDPFSWYEVTCDPDESSENDASLQSLLGCLSCAGQQYNCTDLESLTSGETESYCVCTTDGELCSAPDETSGAAFLAVSSVLLLAIAAFA